MSDVVCSFFVGSIGLSLCVCVVDSLCCVLLIVCCCLLFAGMCCSAFCVDWCAVASAGCCYVFVVSPVVPQNAMTSQNVARLVKVFPWDLEKLPCAPQSVRLVPALSGY